MKILCLALLITYSFSISAQEDYEQRIKDLKIELVEPSKPIGNYTRVVQSGNLLFLAGHGPTKADGSQVTGKLGSELTLEQGKEAARITCIYLLSVLKSELKDLNRIKRIVKLTGWVNSDLSFTEQHLVMNGCSDLLVSVFGENGKHARTSVGTNTLPNNIAVEIEMIVELK